MKHQTSDGLGLSAKSTKTPWHLRFVPTANGIVSFVQNLLPSLTQKEASAAAVLVGIGLLASPMEQAEADVPISGSGAQWATPKYCWSGVFYDFGREFDGLDPWKWENAEDYSFNLGFSLGLHSDDPWKPEINRYYHPAGLWEYYICKIVAKKPGTTEMDKSFGWVDVWFFTGGIGSDGEIFPPSAYVYDSDGNYYYVDLAIDGYVISGPSLD